MIIIILDYCLSYWVCYATAKFRDVASKSEQKEQVLADSFTSLQVRYYRNPGGGIYDIANFYEILSFISGRISANDSWSDTVENHCH